MLAMLKGCSKCPFNFYCLFLGSGLEAEFHRNENTNVDPFNSLQQTVSAEFPLFLQAALLEAFVM
jgi:hypothetical protein